MKRFGPIIYTIIFVAGLVSPVSAVPVYPPPSLQETFIYPMNILESQAPQPYHLPTDVYVEYPNPPGLFDDIVIRSNGTFTSVPTIFIDYWECSHLSQSIICPPLVAQGAGSMYFNSDNWPVFPGINGAPVAVDPSFIYLFPTPLMASPGISAQGVRSQMLSQQPDYTQMTFPNVLFYDSGRNQTVSISGSFDDNSVYQQSPGTNPSIWLTFSSSSPNVTISPAMIPFAVLPARTPACDESFLSITPGYPTYIRARNIPYDGNLYEVDMPVTTLPDGSLGFGIMSLRNGSDCPGSGNSIDLSNGVLTLSKVNVNGKDYSVQFQWTGTAFSILSVQ